MLLRAVALTRSSGFGGRPMTASLALRELFFRVRERLGALFLPCRRDIRRARRLRTWFRHGWTSVTMKLVTNRGVSAPQKQPETASKQLKRPSDLRKLENFEKMKQFHAHVRVTARAVP